MKLTEKQLKVKKSMNSSASNILEVKKIYKSFGGVDVLENVNLKVRQGEVHALLGENGAGKSTLTKIILGVLKKDSGEIFFEKKAGDCQDSEETIGNGIATIFQETSLIPQLTILENIFLGNEITGLWGILRKSEMLEKFCQTCSQMRLELEPDQLVQSLGVAEKKLVEIIKALSKNSRFIIMDEPTDSLPKNDTDHLLSVIRDLKSRRISVLYITHKLDEVFQVSDRISILRNGKNISTVDTANTTEKEIISLIVGETSKEQVKYQKKPAEKKLPILKIDNISLKRKLHNISLDVLPGEILGITGLIGAGKTELARVLFGLEQFDCGRMLLEGSPFNPRSPQEALRAGVYLIPEDRKNEGLIMDFEIYKNVTLPNLKMCQKKFRIPSKKEFKVTNEALTKVGLKAANVHKKTGLLSGGNQQKVVIAKWLENKPKVMILDEPTRGMDVNAKEEIIGIIRKLAEEGSSIIYLSSEFSELKQVSNRILLLHQGHILKSLDMNSTPEEIMNLIVNNKNLVGEN
jgi:ribose transport system ATP-binding protein